LYESTQPSEEITLSWLWLSILSAILLGFYEAAKKHAVDRNAVPAVLMASVTCGALVWGGLMLVGRIVPAAQGTLIDIRPLTWTEHGLILVKSAIVAASWTLAYFSLKGLPLSIASPLRATGPVWTIAMATLFLGERPTYVQWIGVTIVVISFFRFSTIGRMEGIDFRRNIAVAWMIAGTLIGAISGLYDKLLLQRFGFTAAEVQAWFSIDLVIVMIPGFVYWWIRDRSAVPFFYRASIPAIATLLLAADYAYFSALEDPTALVSLVSPVRRLAMVVSLVIGIAHYREKHALQKVICVGIVILGIALISIG
jgi:bacterial/archaeal transporter family protein